MRTTIHKTTWPLIINMAEDGPHTSSLRMKSPNDEECLIVIYPKPTIRQARVQFWMSLKMLGGAIRRGIRGYMRRIDRGHQAAYHTYSEDRELNDRSTSNGNP